VANLIVAERAMQQGIQITFVQYLRVGLPITLISLMIAGWFLG
jgi:Na+/H+ antiporter NhaD/arsenite permease-like protein